jgi:hypothetical protein
MICVMTLPLQLRTVDAGPGKAIWEDMGNDHSANSLARRRNAMPATGEASTLFDATG